MKTYAHKAILCLVALRADRFGEPRSPKIVGQQREPLVTGKSQEVRVTWNVVLLVSLAVRRWSIHSGLEVYAPKAPVSTARRVAPKTGSKPIATVRRRPPAE